MLLYLFNRKVNGASILSLLYIARFLEINLCIDIFLIVYMGLNEPHLIEVHLWAITWFGFHWKPICNNYEGRVFCPPKSQARDFLSLTATFSWFQTGRWRRLVRKRILPLFPLIAPSVWEFRAMTQAHLKSRKVFISVCLIKKHKDYSWIWGKTLFI